MGATNYTEITLQDNKPLLAHYTCSYVAVVLKFLVSFFLIKDRSRNLKVVDSFLSWLEIAPYNLNSRIIFTVFSSRWQSNIMAKLALQLLTTLSPHRQWGLILSEGKLALSYITLTIQQDNFTLKNTLHLYPLSYPQRVFAISIFP